MSESSYTILLRVRINARADCSHDTQISTAWCSPLQVSTSTALLVEHCRDAICVENQDPTCSTQEKISRHWETHSTAFWVDDATAFHTVTTPHLRCSCNCQPCAREFSCCRWDLRARHESHALQYRARQLRRQTWRVHDIGRNRQHGRHLDITSKFDFVNQTPLSQLHEIWQLEKSVPNGTSTIFSYHELQSRNTSELKVFRGLFHNCISTFLVPLREYHVLNHPSSAAATSSFSHRFLALCMLTLPLRTSVIFLHSSSSVRLLICFLLLDTRTLFDSSEHYMCNLLNFDFSN